MLKLIGCGIVLSAAALWGAYMCREARRTLMETEALAAFVRRTGESIEMFSFPLERIYADFSDPFLDSTGFTEVLREKGLSAALEASVTSLSDASRAELFSFAKELGGGDKDGQVRLCRLCAGRLSDEAARLSEEMPAKLRMYRLMPPLAVSGILLLLI